MLTRDPSGLRPRPFKDCDDGELSTTEELEVDLYVDIIEDSSSDDDSDFEGYYDCTLETLMCQEGPLSDSSSDSDSGADNEAPPPPPPGAPQPLPHVEDPTIEELLQEFGGNNDNDQEECGWTCYFCEGPLNPTECFLYGAFDEEHSKGMCNSCYVSTLSDFEE
ncbi:E7 [Pygoscelis adeliae papillomavirus 1]|uniref:E7 n=1 Tax=Pygoscelis adeliae papillomavirus 1 TaxID=1480065 RepID=X2JJ81_9PAPI|nr:E7 [Pygoscelis adeliae papillomavirus 1]AHN65799.1 E7 [Pygoscelis adeliae papillomavirus 1]